MSSIPRALIESKADIWQVLFNLLYVRVALTVVLIAWGAYISWTYNKTTDPVKQEKIKYTNFLWAGSGKTGIFMTIFWIWFLTILAVSAYPLLQKLIPWFFQH